jgi:hypothetical protein
MMMMIVVVVVVVVVIIIIIIIIIRLSIIIIRLSIIMTNVCMYVCMSVLIIDPRSCTRLPPASIPATDAAAERLWQRASSPTHATWRQLIDTQIHTNDTYVAANSSADMGIHIDTPVNVYE